MKKLYRRLAIILLFSTVLILLFFTISLYARSRRGNYQYLSQLLGSVETNIRNASNEYEERLELLKDDYLNRALAVEYILSSDSQMISDRGLDIVKGLMEIKSISVYDSSGKMIGSTEDSTKERSAKQVKSEEFWQEKDGKPYHIHIDQAEFDTIPSSFYVIVQSDSPYFSFVRIDMDTENLEFLSRKELIEKTLKQATTEYDTSVIAIGRDSGKIVGMTKNNQQVIRISGGENAKDLLSLLESLEEDKPILLRINGKYQRTVITKQEGMFLAAFTDLSQLYGDIAWTFFEGLIGIGTISVLTIVIVRVYLKKYLFGHFELVKTSIRGILEGGNDTDIEEAGIPELKALVETILELEKGYISKSEGISRMEDQLSVAQSEAKSDRLTGLYNRNGFERHVEEYLLQPNPSGVLVLFDLDNFKRVNDMEGHPEGDRILERFAECLSAGFRKTDCIARLGGDEFIVLVQNRVSQGILEDKFEGILTSVRAALGNYYAKYGVSVSIGAVPVDGTIKSYEKLYRCADTALYIAKHLGKDRFYVNYKKISCMKRKCIQCRKDCPRSKVLELKNEKKAEEE